jgi:acyl-CoA thioesterase I
VCAGDSITAADVSSDWIGRLRDRFTPRGWVFVNAGVNGNLAWNVRQRLDEVIDCRPDAVVLFIGTNDVAATLNDKAERSYRKLQGIPQTPTLSWYRENVDAILGRLRAETSAKIAVVEIPPLGEDPHGPIDARVRRYNSVLRELAKLHSAELLPLHTRLLALIPDGHAAAAYAHTMGPMLRAVFAHRILKRSWDEISLRNSLVITTDRAHLNDRASAVVAELTGAFLERALGSIEA